MATNGLERLVDVAVEVPHKPGAFSIDCGALRMLLFDIIRLLRQTGEGGGSALQASSERLTQEVNSLQFRVKQLEKQVDQQMAALDAVSKLEENMAEIRENERLISDSMGVIASNMEAFQDQLEALETNIATVDTQPTASGAFLVELKERMDALESESSFVKKGGSLRQVSFPVLEQPPVEPKRDMVTPFLDFKRRLGDLGMDKVAAVEDFLGTLNNSRTIQPKMLQELLVIFSLPEVDFLPLIMEALSQSEHLTVSALREILEFTMTTASNTSSMVALFSAISGQCPRLTIDAFADILTSIRDTMKVTPNSLTSLLTILIKCDELVEFLQQLTLLESWSWQAMINIVEEFHFSKNSTVQELVLVMQKMSAEEINELMSMLLTIPGYVNELMFSLPHPPPLSTQRLLEHLISLPDDSPNLLAQIVDLMVSTPKRKNALLTMCNALLDLSTSMETDFRSPDNGFYMLLKTVHTSEHVTLSSVVELFSLLSLGDVFPMEAARSLVQFSRECEQFVDALRDLLRAMVGSRQLKADHISRLLRLLEKAKKTVTPAHIEDLLQALVQSGMLKDSNFYVITELFRENALNTPYNICEFLSSIQNVHFLTLDDLAHVLEQEQASARKAYEEALDGHNRKIQELKELQQRREAQMNAMSSDDTGEQVDLEMTEDIDFKDVDDTVDAKDTGMTSKDTPSDPTNAAYASMAANQQAQAETIQDLQKEMKEIQECLNNMVDSKPRRKDSLKERKKKMVAYKIATDRERGGSRIRPSSDKGGEKVDKPDKERGGSRTRPSSDRGREKVDKPDTQRKLVAELLDVDGGSSHSVSRSGTAKAKESPLPPPTTPEADVDSAVPTLREGSFSMHLDDSIESTLSSDMHSLQFSQTLMETSLKEVKDKLDDMIRRLNDHEELCQQRFQTLREAVGVKAEIGELAQFKMAVKKQLHNFINKTVPEGPAGTKRRMAYSCLSCDKSGVANQKNAEQCLPMSGAFPTVVSQRPHRLFEMDLIRRHARSLLAGRNERVNLYSIPRPCGGQHTSVDVRQTWTYEIHQKASCARDCDKQAYNATSMDKTDKGRETSSSSSQLAPHPPHTHRPS